MRRRISGKHLAIAGIVVAVAVSAIVGVRVAGDADPASAPEQDGSTPAAIPSPTDPASALPGKVIAADGSETTTTAAGAMLKKEEQEKHEPYADGEVLVQLRAGTSVAELRRAVARVDGVGTDELVENDVAAGFAKLTLAEGVAVEDAVAALKQVGVPVTDAQPNYVYELFGKGSVTVNDPYANMQWGLESMHVYDAWDVARSSKPRAGEDTITVAVLDGGFDLEHKDLKENFVAPYNATKGVPGTYENMKGYDHGSLVSGCISAVADNSVGVAGVSYNARLMPINCELAGEPGYIDTYGAARGFDYVMDKAAEYNVRVVNMSWGGGEDDALLDDRMARVYEAGIVLVAAAGNEGQAIYSHPSDDEHVISVMALCLDKSGKSVTRSWFSSYNLPGSTDKNISAPGEGIISTSQSLANEGSYLCVNDGTSFASPYVAGIVALMLTANPKLAPRQVADLLYDTAEDLGSEGFDEEYGYGEVDALAAVIAARDAA